MMIEFCGLPGVGKSTTARALEVYGFTRVRIKNKTELLILNVQYICVYPFAFFKMFVQIFRTSLQFDRFYPLFMNVFLDTNARILKAKRSKELMIVDQGHLQGLLSLSYRALNESDVVRFVSGLPKPDKIFFFRAPTHIREDRLVTRGYGPREGEKRSELWLQYLESNMEVVRTAIQRSALGAAQTIETDQPLEQILAEIRERCSYNL